MINDNLFVTTYMTLNFLEQLSSSGWTPITVSNVFIIFMWVFERWINTIHRISHYQVDSMICFVITIYLVDSIIQPSNKNISPKPFFFL